MSTERSISPTSPTAAPSLLRTSALVLGLAAAPAGFAATATVDNPGSGHNRIEVTGNSASRVTVRCADGSTRTGSTGGNVNSVNVDRNALRGRTEIVTGRNVQDVQGTTDCNGSNPTAAPGQGAANVNSINIR